MTFELVMATLGRHDRVRKFCEELAGSTHKEVLLTIVDQGDDDAVERAVTSLRLPFRTQVLRSAVGLSRARNVALRQRVGDVIAFPDDDCVYPSSLLERIARTLDARPACGGVTCASRANDGIASGARWRGKHAIIRRSNVWRTAISYTIFLRREVVDVVGEFDESLGLGAGTRWGSGEETDYILRALDRGIAIEYLSDLFVFHPVNERTAARGRAYGMGMGRVLRKHGLPRAVTAYHCARPLGGAMVAALRNDWSASAYHLSVAQGRTQGYLAEE